MIIVDMNLSPDWVQVLSQQGFEAQHWRGLGPVAADDRAIFDHARQSGAIILTQDLDFGVILAQTHAPKPSVILLRLPDVDPARAGTAVAATLRVCDAELAAGAILTIDEDRHRVRLLPLHPEISSA